MGSEGTDRLVLVVDDNEDDRMFVRDALRQVAPEVLVAELGDGVELLEYLRDRTRPFPDLVLLDLQMPRKDGLETLAEIRLDSSLRHVPVIAVFTTATDQEFVRRAYSSGANAYVGKPSTMAGLRDIMAGLVQHWFEIVTLPGSR
jgi:CheY-like chemotaxis protein